MPDIQLNFVNKSNDHNNSSIVIFPKNETTGSEEIAVAWRVIQNCGPGFNHPFIYPMGYSISVADSWGNYSPQLEANNGQLFEIIRDESGDVLKYAGPATARNEIQVVNGLSMGSINANLYKDGHLFATKTGIAPGQKASFSFKPVIWIGVASEIEEGAIMNTAVISDINTELSLFGIRSADIVMTGGGPGADSIPFIFTMENIQYA